MNDEPMDSELWLFFHKGMKLNDTQCVMRLRLIETSINFEMSGICVHRSFLSHCFPKVTCWTPSEDINPKDDELVVISIRLNSKEKDVFRKTIRWTLNFDIIAGSVSETATTTLITGENAEEGVSDISISSDDRKKTTVPLRYLIIWDTIAPPSPGLHCPSVDSENKSWLPNSESRTPLLVGHRGMGALSHASNPSQHLGDNTLAAFNTAEDLGADMVELDVQLSRDCYLVVNHDFTMGEGLEKFRDLSLSQIKKLRPDILTLPDVFQNVDRRLGIDVEVKYPMLMKNGLLETDEEDFLQMDIDGLKVVRWPKNELAEIVLKVLEPEAQKRRLLISTFNPNMALVLSRKISPILRASLPVINLTRGECHFDCVPERFHADLRNKTVASACCWARAIDLDGVAPFAASAFSVQDPASTFGNDLSTFLWGWALNSERVLKKYKEQKWVCGLIFDDFDVLFPLVKRAS